MELTIGNVINQVKRVFDRGKWTESSVRIVEGNSVSGAKMPTFNHHAAIAAFNSWVYRAAMLNAQAVASVPLRLFVRADATRSKSYGWESRKVGPRLNKHLLSTASAHVQRKAASFREGFEEFTVGPDGNPHPAIDVLERANPWMNGFDMTVLKFVYLQLTGNAYIHTVTDRALGIPSELWIMPSQWTKVIPDRDEFISGYIYGKGQDIEREFAVDEVDHFKLPNPGDLYYGKSMLEAAWSANALHESKRMLDISRYENNAIPPMLVTVKGGVQPKQLERYEAQWNNHLRGVRNAGKIRVVSGDVTATPLSPPQGEIGDPDRVIEEIAGMFGVPITKLLANDPNRANAQTGDAGWMRDTVLPMLRMDEQKLNETYLTKFPGLEGKAFLAYDNPVPQNVQQIELETSAKVASGRMTINEARQQDGMDAIEGGEVPRVNGVPLDMVGQQPMSQPFQFNMVQPAAIVDTSRVAASIDFTPTNKKREQSNGNSDRNQPTSAAGNSSGGSSDYVGDSRGDTGDRGDDGKDHNQGLVAQGEGHGTGDLGVSGRAVRVVNPDRDTPDQPGGKAPQPGDQKVSRTVRQAVKELDDGCTRSGSECGSIDSGIVNDVADLQGNGKDQPAMASCQDVECRHVECVKHSDYIYKVDAQEDIREGQPVRPEDKLAAELADIFERAMAQVAQRVGKTVCDTVRVKITSRQVGSVLQEMTDKINTDVSAAFNEHLPDMVIGGMKLGARGISFDLDPSAQASIDAVRDLTRQLSDRIAGEIAKTTSDRIGTVIRGGLSEGLRPEQLSELIRNDESGQFGSARATAIARTEMADAFIQGEKQSWKFGGITKMKWLLAPNACPFCVAAAGKMNKGGGWPIDEPLFTKGDSITTTEGTLSLDYRDITSPPLHPHDRCTLVAVVEG